MKCPSCSLNFWWYNVPFDGHGLTNAAAETVDGEIPQFEYNADARIVADMVNRYENGEAVPHQQAAWEMLQFNQLLVNGPVPQGHPDNTAADHRRARRNAIADHAEQGPGPAPTFTPTPTPVLAAPPVLLPTRRPWPRLPPPPLPPSPPRMQEEDTVQEEEDEEDFVPRRAVSAARPYYESVMRERLLNAPGKLSRGWVPGRSAQPRHAVNLTHDVDHGETRGPLD